MTDAELSAALSGTQAEALLASFGIERRFLLDNVFGAAQPVTVSQLAMLWMGMPNKHDRKRVRQLLDALVEAHLMEPIAEDTYRAR